MMRIDRYRTLGAKVLYLSTVIIIQYVANGLVSHWAK